MADMIEKLGAKEGQYTSFNLFELPCDAGQTPPNPEKPIVLDPSKTYAIPSGYRPIASELDWMRDFEINGSLYWVQGETLCDWTQTWLRCWNRSHLIHEIKRPPQEKLTHLFDPIAIPADWTEQQCLAVVTHLERYRTQPIAHLLSDLTVSDPEIWLSSPSVENLARWLPLEVPEEAQVLEQVWQTQRPSSELNPYYQTDNKHHLLKQWLGLTKDKSTDLASALGDYPLDVPPNLQTEFKTFWQHKLHATQGSILDTLDLNSQPFSKQIATQAYEVFNKHPQYRNSVREKQLKGYISHEQYQDLTQDQRPPEPKPLSLDASPEDVLTWVTKAYLPLRKWETVIANFPQEKQVCHRLASSFEDWILHHYPTLTVDAVSTSWLNYNVSHQVEELCKDSSVFWVVVDGLGWLDHQTLLDMLTKDKKLQLKQGLQPRFSILPTKTEYAKWSLYSQQCPSHETWKADAGKGFHYKNGKRYTDNDVTKKRLQRDLERGKLRLYCWDTDRFDKLFHKETDWQELYTIKRRRELQAITEDIWRFIALHPQPDKLHIVIASDHGQLMGNSPKLVPSTQSLDLKGRMAIGKVEHLPFTVLDKTRFSLPHDVSVIRGCGSFSSFSYTTKQSATGCHGGLYPEEVIVGFSVLTQSVKRDPIIIKCSGEGRPGENSTLRVEIYNPNAVAIEDLRLRVNQVVSLQQGKDLDVTVQPHQRQLIEIPISTWPELPPTHEGKYLSLTGKLEFQYQNAERGWADLDKESSIKVHQIFSSGMESGLDDFL